MPLRSEHFTTPIKLVLPGIIVSVIGASAGFYLFNNPIKIRAKSSYTAWKVINRFEEIFEENSDLIPCRSDTFDLVQMKKDYIHLLEMTRQNIEDLKKEDNIDKRLSAIINLKIDSYNEIKKITETFLENISSLNDKAKEGNYSAEQKLAMTRAEQTNYIIELIHISNRDTSMIKQILNELTQSYSKYVDSFKVNVKIQSPEEIQKFTLGRWLTTDKVLISINKDGKGTWKQAEFENGFTWKFDTSMIEKDTLHPKMTKLDIKFDNGNHVPMEMIKANKDIIFFMFHDQAGNEIYANACRQNDVKD